MSHGIQIFSASGQEMLSTEDFATRFIRTVNITGSTAVTFPSQGSMSVPELAGEARVWFQAMATPGEPLLGPNPYGYNRYQAARIAINGTTLSWVYDETYTGGSYVYIPMTVIIGAY